MSVFIGFTSRGTIRPTGEPGTNIFSWKFQPWDRGSNPKPDPIDSSLLTLEIVPTIDDYTGNEAVLGYTELFARMTWSAGEVGRLPVEFDIVRGASATVAATSIQLVVVYAMLNPGNNPNLPQLAGIKPVGIDGTLGRGSRSSNDALTRTKYLGPLAGGVASAPQKIPNFARALYLTSRVAGAPAFTAVVVQRSGSPTGPIVQADLVTGTQPIQPVPISALASYVEVTPAAAQDLSVVFRIILP